MCLETVFTLVRAKFRLAQPACEGGEKMRERLRVVVDVRTRARATATFRVVAAFPGPDAAIGLSQNGWGFQSGQVGSHRLDDFRRERRIVKRLAEAARCLLERCVLSFPMA